MHFVCFMYYYKQVLYVEVNMNTNCIGLPINGSIEWVRFRGTEYGKAQVTRKFKENVIQ